MRAFAYHAYGSPDVLVPEERPAPNIAADEVLVEVRATAVNPADWHMLRGDPYVMRLGFGLTRPRHETLGMDFAGVVRAVGADVEGLSVGAVVAGAAPRGAFAELLAVRARDVALVPSGITMEQAAAIPLAGNTALQGVRLGGVTREHRVLVHGASGGVGTFAVQLVKMIGAHVTAVCSGRNAERMRALGADEVIDYTREDFAAREGAFDVLLDFVGDRSVADCRRALRERGTYVSSGGHGSKWFGPILRLLGMAMIAPFTRQSLRVLFATSDAADVAALFDLVWEGKLTPVIDRTYPFEATPEALRYLETGRARGKVVITV